MVVDVPPLSSETLIEVGILMERVSRMFLSIVMYIVKFSVIKIFSEGQGVIRITLLSLYF